MDRKVDKSEMKVELDKSRLKNKTEFERVNSNIGYIHAQIKNIASLMVSNAQQAIDINQNITQNEISNKRNEYLKNTILLQS